MSDDQDCSDEGGETYIDPNDLDIINNEANWEPTDEEIITYARQLEFDVDNDPQEFLEIAYSYLKNPLPKTWRRAFRKDNGQVLYIDMTTNEIHLTTQIEEMAKQEYIQYKKEYEQKIREEDEAKKKVTVVPRKKIPPIGGTKPIEDKNQKKEKEFMNNLKKEKAIEEKKDKEREMIEIKKNIARQKVEVDDEFEEVVPPKRKSHKEKDKRKGKEDKEFDYNKGRKVRIEKNDSDDDEFDQVVNISNDYKIEVKDDDEEEEEEDKKKQKRESRRHQPEVFIDEIKQDQYNKEKQQENDLNQAKDKDKNKAKSKTSNILDLNDDIALKDDNNNNNAFIPQNHFTTPERSIKPSITTTQNPNPSPKDLPQKHYSSLVELSNPLSSNDHLKQAYLTTSMTTLEHFKESLINHFQSFIDNFNTEQSETYERNLLREKRKLKDQHDKDHKTFLSTLQEDYEDTYKKTLSSYQLSLNTNKTSQVSSIEYYEQDIERLTKDKNELLHSIQIQRDNNKIQRERRIQSRKTQLIQAKYVMDEKLKIQKEAMLMKNRKDTVDKEHNYEIQLRNIQQQPLFNPSASINNNSIGSLLGTSTMIDYKGILDEYQRILDEMYISKTMEIKREFERNKDKDIDDFKLMSINESQNKISLAHKEIDGLEIEYYNELQIIRQKSKLNKDRHIKDINDRLTGTAMNFDAIKGKSMQLMDDYMKQLINLLQEQIRTSNDYSNIIDGIESKCEEVISLKMNEVHVMYRRMRTMYEMTEKDFKHKHLLLMYFADIAFYLVKKMIERPMIITSSDNITVDDDLINEVMNVGRSKIGEYRMKYMNIKDVRLFPFLEGYNGMTGLNKVQYWNNQYLQQSTMDLNSNRDRDNNRIMFMTGSFDQNIGNNPNNTYINPIQSQSFSNLLQHQQQQSMPIPITNQSHSNTIRVLPINSYTNRDNNLITNTDRYGPQISLNDQQMQVQDQDIINQSAHFPKDKDDHFQQSQQQQQQQIQTQQSITSNQTLTLPQEITSKLPDDEFLIYSTIIDFLRDESTSLSKEQIFLNHQRQLNDQLSQMNNNGDLLQFNHAFNAEKIKWITNDKAYRNKIELFSIVKIHIDDIFNFIISNSTRNSVVMDKLKLIMKHVNDYKSDYNLNASIGIDNTNQMPIPIKKCSQCDCNCSRQVQIQEPTINNSFTNFYSLYRPNTLSNRINTNFSHEFFTFKKHSEYVNQKMEATRRTSHGY